MVRKLIKVSGLVLLSVALLILYLVRFQGLRIERSGSGTGLFFSFYNPEQQLAAIEQNRAEAPPTPAAIPAPAKRESTQPHAAPKPYWTDFRGPHRDGRYDELPIQVNWPAAGPARLWRKPIGEGYASFVVANGLAFTIEQRRNQEVAAAYDLSTGREVWSHAWDAYFRESMGGDGPRATPTWNDGRLYALGAAGELRCLDAATGRRIWSKSILNRNGSNLEWGMSASPLVVDEKLIVQSDRSVAAYHKVSGELVWQALEDKQAYTSPMLVTLAGERQILAVTAHRAAGLSPDGKVFWNYPWKTSYDVNVAQPVIAGPDRFILSAGYGHGAALVRVTREGDSFRAATVWESNRMKNKFTSSVLHEGHLYGLDENILACIDATTGELKWKGGRYGYGQVMVASGLLFVTTEDGDVAVVRATPERHMELTRFPAVSGKTWNHPAIAHGILLVRSGAEMSAFRL